MQHTFSLPGSGLRAVRVRSDSRRSVAPVRSASRRHAVSVAAALAPPTVADTRLRFYEAYRRPVPAIYNVVLQELLVQQHFIRYNVNYQYNEVYALGFVSVFDQVLDSFDQAERAKVFDAYISALGEDPRQYRVRAAADVERLESEAAALGGADALTPDADGGELQRALARLAEQSAAKRLPYNKFLAIGLFRLLELTGAKEPAALERLVKAVGASPQAVNKDLLLYKGILSKMSAAKELMKEFLEREKKKQAEREAAKAARAAAPQPTGAAA
ncbi:thylakoid formation protein 1 [Monoraphidium neglectum]|uniref:Thylakoid formation protein 1 n=1 Tax=Monoraphidium neglectum TaxID=145388 RepID=A0A0D2MEP3_9CHLO|nr:thylakoid formation protein 1 [Monoraphidium neglectum]KIY99156.1 thylakoid formation protein 1 [Monoraphidium neglectum]|eukprot:XP_013898176.1 thylakoid formation protein 1 [Monoraphidium neglectum]